MNAGWITSAAIAGLVIAVFVYPWQRYLEHRFILKKEKREAYREVLRNFAKVKVAIMSRDFELAKRHAFEIEGIGYEATLLSSNGVSDVLLRVAERVLSYLPSCRSWMRSWFSTRNERTKIRLKLKRKSVRLCTRLGT